MSPAGTFESNRTDAPVAPAVAAAPKTAKKLRVCHVSMCLLTGGLERLLVEFGKNRDGEKFDTSFVALDGMGVPAEELKAQGHHVECVSDVVAGKLARLRRLAHIFRDGQFDVVHTHNTLAPDLQAGHSQFPHDSSDANRRNPEVTAHHCLALPRNEPRNLRREVAAGHVVPGNQSLR